MNEAMIVSLSVFSIVSI